MADFNLAKFSVWDEAMFSSTLYYLFLQYYKFNCVIGAIQIARLVFAYFWLFGGTNLTQERSSHTAYVNLFLMLVSIVLQVPAKKLAPYVGHFVFCPCQRMRPNQW